MLDNLEKLDRAENMKFLNDTFPLLHSITKLPCLPQSYKFPTNLKKLTLSETLLDWGHISILGVLPNLKVLKLKEYAFKGPRRETLEGGFCQLKMLQLRWIDIKERQQQSNVAARVDRYQNVVTQIYKRLIQQKRQQQSSVHNGLKLIVYPLDL